MRYTFGFELTTLTPAEKASGKEQQVLFRITFNRVRARLKTGIDLDAKWWNKAAEEVRKGHGNEAVHNATLTRYRHQAEALSEEFQRRAVHLTAAEFRDRLRERLGGSQDDFLAYALRWIEQNAARLGIRTKQRYESYVTKLRMCCADKDGTLAFARLSPNLVKNYHAWLTSAAGGNAVNTAAKNIAFFKQIGRAAVQEGILEHAANAWQPIKLVHTKVKKERLDESEVKQLQAAPDLNVKERVALDIWLFQYWCGGARFGDAVRAKWSQISADGRWNYAMEKTGADRSVKLQSAARALVESYRTPASKPTNFIFPPLQHLLRKFKVVDDATLKKKTEIANAMTNLQLKEVARKACIYKNVTTHVARHSFANQARKRKLPLYDISQALGHANIAQTQTYLDSFDQGAADSVTDALFGE